ncbi:MAG: InlB B-repeat-containing protein [Clostridia bacterium]|nr:InlB B-repeat-containing protein [Clostridia bacterium]
MKKITTMILTGVFCLALVFSAGCTGETLYPTYEDGFFVYYKPPKDEFVAIIGLTELGHQQKIIIMPETIGGYKYIIREIRGWGEKPVRWGENNTLEKIYFEYDMHWYGYNFNYTSNTFNQFSKLKKIIVNNKSAKTLQHVFTNKLYAFQENDQTIFVPSRALLANAQFIYNYDEAPNEGYYWIDDIDDGEKIEIIPPAPEREGYIFSGWYCEPECENEWDFNNKIIKKEIEQGDFYPDDYVTYIYAKWNKK